MSSEHTTAAAAAADTTYAMRLIVPNRIVRSEFSKPT